MGPAAILRVETLKLAERRLAVSKLNSEEHFQVNHNIRKYIFMFFSYLAHNHLNFYIFANIKKKDFRTKLGKLTQIL